MIQFKYLQHTHIILCNYIQWLPLMSNSLLLNFTLFQTKSCSPWIFKTGLLSVVFYSYETHSMLMGTFALFGPSLLMSLKPLARHAQ